MRSASWIFSRWVRKILRPAHIVRPSVRRPAFHPRLEGLEDRAVPATFVVTNTLDDGSAGSLRWAINQTNADTDAVSRINFDIPVTDPGYDNATGVFTIAPTAGLPVLGHPVVVDGYTQPGASANTLTQGDNATLNIQLNLSAVSASGYGLWVAASDCTIRGLIVNGLNNSAGSNPDAILLHGGDDSVQGCFIGTDAAGSSIVGGGPGATGIEVYDSVNNLVGGTTPDARNLIAGWDVGIGQFSDFALSGPGLIAEGNYIGTDASGTQALGNTQGVLMQYNGGIVGGTAPGAGNLISGNQWGIAVGGGSVQIQGNLIGTDAAGTGELGNEKGVFVFGDSPTLIGGTTSDARNIISGNAVGVYNQDSPETQIQGNFVGTDVTGTSPVGNDDGVVLIGDGSVVGGTAPGAKNLISGNTDGIRIFGNANQVEGNLIGTDVTGTLPLGNGGAGVRVYGGYDNNVIGGTSPGDSNVISGNFIGADVLGSGTLVAGNYIGTDSSGTRAIVNGWGVILENGATGNTVQGNVISQNSNYGISVYASDNVIGGTSAGDGNVISANGGNGVYVTGATGVSILGNSISANGILGIDIDGANDGQAAPVLTAASAGAGSTTVQGTLAGAADTSFRIELFSNAGPDAGGNFEGEQFLGFTTVTTDGSGSAVFNVTLPGEDASAPYITATATRLDSYGEPTDTSEFSAPYSATIILQSASAIAVVSSASTPLPGQSVTFTVTVSAAAGTPTGTVQFQVDGNNFGTPVALVNGVAGASIATSAVGAHTVTALYSGDSSFLASAGSAAITVIPPGSLSGMVWEDFNNDGQVDFGENGIHGVSVRLTGADDLGNSVNLSQTTDADGAYLFLNLRPGTYYITETQPAGYLQGIDSVGTGGGSLAGTDQFLIPLGPGVNGLNYNFGEQPAAGGPVTKGQTAGIGFWNNKNGQALIKSLNGGVGTELADWLAATLPNMFGVNAGSNNLTGKSNAYVANLFQQDFLLKGVKLDAQVLATALSVYATSATLDSTGAATQYGFTVSGDGVGTAAVNVGSDGDAFGVANNTVLTVMDLLLATDAQAVNGVLYGGYTAKRNEANDVFSAVNQAGGM